MFAQGQVLRLHRLQPLSDGLLCIWAGNDWQGVDEQANLLFDAFEFCRAARYGCAKTHTVLSGIAL